MPGLVRVVVGALLVAHGLVHLLYVADDVTEFELDHSWLVPDGVARSVGLGLMAATIAAFALVGLAVWGVPGLASAWPVLTVVASALSLGLLLAYWDVQVMLGVAIDVGLVVVAVLRPGWTETIG